VTFHDRWLPLCLKPLTDVNRLKLLEQCCASHKTWEKCFTEGRLFNSKMYLIPAHFLSFSQFYCDKLLVNFLTNLERMVLNCLRNLNDSCMQNIRRGKHFPSFLDLIFVLPRYWAVKRLQNIRRITCGCHIGVYTCRYFFNRKYFWRTFVYNRCRQTHELISTSLDRVSRNFICNTVSVIFLTHTWKRGVLDTQQWQGKRERTK